MILSLSISEYLSSNIIENPHEFLGTAHISKVKGRREFQAKNPPRWMARPDVNSKDAGIEWNNGWTRSYFYPSAKLQISTDTLGSRRKVGVGESIALQTGLPDRFGSFIRNSSTIRFGGWDRVSDFNCIPDV